MPTASTVPSPACRLEFEPGISRQQAIDVIAAMVLGSPDVQILDLRSSTGQVVTCRIPAPQPHERFEPFFRTVEGPR